MNRRWLMLLVVLTACTRAQLGASSAPPSPPEHAPIEPLPEPEPATEPSPEPEPATVEAPAFECGGDGVDLERAWELEACGVDDALAVPFVKSGALVLELPHEVRVKAGESVAIPVVIRNVGAERSHFDFWATDAIAVADTLTRDGELVPGVGGCYGGAYIGQVIRVSLAPNEAANALASFYAVESQQHERCGRSPALARGAYALRIFIRDRSGDQLDETIELVIE